MPEIAVCRWNGDKSSWPDGPWMREPDCDEWTDELSGYSCLIWRHRHEGHLCGYVGIPEGHPLVGTTARTSDQVDPAWGDWAGDKLGIATLAAAWWFGFDCGHLGQVLPAQYRPERDDHKDYAGFDEVRSQVVLACDTLREIATLPPDDDTADHQWHPPADVELTTPCEPKRDEAELWECWSFCWGLWARRETEVPFARITFDKWLAERNKETG